MKAALIIVLLVLLMSFYAPPQNTTQAQSQNILVNPSFDGGLTPVSGGAVPSGWSWYGNGYTDKESLSALVRSGQWSWRLRQEWGLLTAGGYQTVNVQQGATYRFAIFAMIWTCDDEVYACRNETSTFSDTTSGGRVRIGIDPTGGTDPYSGNVQWSGFRSPFTWGTFEYLSMDAVATSSRMTVFTYYTADKVMRFHDVFWDDASLTLVSQPSGNTGGNTGGDSGGNSGESSVPRNTVAPVEVDPVERADGSLVHIVRSGQTLWTISLAYDISLDDIRAYNGLYDSDIIVTGQELIVQPSPQSLVTSTSPPPATATITPTIVVTPTTSVTPFMQGSATIVAQAETIAPNAPTSTIATVRIEPVSNNQQDGAFRSGVIALAVTIVIVGVGAIGGIGFILWQSLFARRPRL